MFDLKNFGIKDIREMIDESFHHSFIPTLFQGVGYRHDKTLEILIFGIIVAIKLSKAKAKEVKNQIVRGEG